MTKWFLKVAALLAFVGLLFGLVLPKMISAASNIMVVGGFAVLIGAIALVAWVIEGETKKKLNDNKTN